MRTALTAVLDGCHWQADLCRRNGSPTYVALIEEIVARLGHDEALTDLLTADGQDPVRSALCLRLFGAVNRLAMAAEAPWLGKLYPTFGGSVDTDRAVQEFLAFAGARWDDVAVEMRTGVQTNEVGRAAPLSAAMNHVAAVTGHPLRLLEVGASAGLNLWLDRYGYAAGGRTWGRADSPLQLVDHFESGDVPTAGFTVVERRGCDLEPLDVHSPGTATLLRSFVWPEHEERRARLDAALEVAQQQPGVPIEAADATAWVEQHTADLPAGVTTVLFHSIVMPYLSRDDRAAFGDAVRRAGARAAGDRPLAWISLEPSDSDSGVVLLTCETWPGGDRRQLAVTTPHGLQVRWDPREVDA